MLHTLQEGTDATFVPQQLLHCAIPAPRCADVPIVFVGVSGSTCVKRTAKYYSTGCPEELFAHESAKNNADLLAQVMRVPFRQASRDINCSVNRSSTFGD